MNTSCTELDDKEALSLKENMVFGGIVTAVRTGMTKQGKPYGIVTIDDYNGSGELALFDEWGTWSGYFVVGVALYIRATCKKRFQNSKYYDLKIGSVMYMSDVKEKSIEKITISMKSDSLTEDLVNDLTSVISSTEGKVPLYFRIYYPKYKNVVVLRAKTTGVSVDYRLTNFIDSKDELSYCIN